MEDCVVPDGKWVFDADVAACFDNMLERSIPQYKAMRGAVAGLAAQYLDRRYSLVDLGCSRGTGLRRVLDVANAWGCPRPRSVVGCDYSEPMVEVARQNLAGIADIQHIDLRHEYPHSPYLSCVTLGILTVQFVSIEHRQSLIRRVYEQTAPGGVFILVEKVLGNTARFDSDFVKLYYSLKRANGYTDQQIESKRDSLEGVLVPLTAGWNESMLRDAGFSEIDCFWRWMNFAGWIARKNGT